MTGYTLALATVIPMTGWAADRFGTKRLFMGPVLAFTLGSLLCAMAPNILQLIVFRVVQGIGGGMLLPLEIHDHDPRGGPAAARSPDVDPEHPDAARPDRWADPGRLADRHLQLASGSS